MASKELAWKIRRHAVEMTHLSGGSHIGAVFSVSDIIGVLYSDFMHFNANDPKCDKRDRFILSKGHAGASIYAALAENGFFPVEELKTHYQNGSRLSGHVSHHLPGIDFSTGSLGHGLSVAAGMALAAKQDSKDHRVFAVLGDGECNEGSVWESALFANNFRLSNLIAIVDHNHMQSLDYCENTLEFDNLANKWRAFGWDVCEVDGHDHDALRQAFQKDDNRTKPLVVIAHTIKGKGVSFMQEDILWHYRFPHEGWEYDTAVCELHADKPDGVIDPYTPEGIPAPCPIPEDADIKVKHILTETYHPTFFKKEG